MTYGFELDEAGDTGSVEKDESERSVQNPTWRYWLVGPIAFLYFFGMNMSLFVVGQYVYRRIQVQEYPNKTFETGKSFCSLNYSDPDTLRLVNVQQKAADYNIMFNLIAGVPSIITNVLLGAYTDRYGRKFLMVIAMTGTLLRVTICLIGVYTTMNIKLFGLAFGVEGLTGQVFTMLLACYAYVSDITVKKNRALGIVGMEVCIGLGTSLPNFAAGYFLEASGFKNPFIASLVILVVAIALTLFVLPESYPKEKRVRQDKTCMNLRDAIGFYVSPSNAGRRWKYIISLVIFYLCMNDVMGRTYVETLFQMNAPFCWTPAKLGLFAILRSGLQQVLGMISVVPLKLYFADDSIGIIGCVSLASAFVLEAFSKNDTMLYFVTVLGAWGMLTVPMIRSIMSKMTNPKQQGALQASISVAETTCLLTSNLIANGIYKNTVSTFGGAVFLVMAAFSVVALLLMIILKCGSRNDEDDDSQIVTVQHISFTDKEKKR